MNAKTRHREIRGGALITLARLFLRTRLALCGAYLFSINRPSEP